MKYYTVTRDRGGRAVNIMNHVIFADAQKTFEEAKVFYRPGAHFAIWEHDTEDDNYAEQMQ